MRRIDLGAIAAHGLGTTLLAFSEPPPQAWLPRLRSASFRVVVDRRQKMIPSAAYVFAPTTLVLDDRGKVASAYQSLDGSVRSKGGER